MTVLGQHVTPLPGLVTREARSPVLLLLAGIGCVLLMACANSRTCCWCARAGAAARCRFARHSVRRCGSCSARRRPRVQCSWASVERRALCSPSAAVDVSGARHGCRSRAWVNCRSGGRQLRSPPRCARRSRSCLAASRCCTCGVETSSMGCGRTPAITADPRAVYVQRLALATQVALVVVLTVTGGLLAAQSGGAARRRSRVQPARRDGDPRRSGRTPGGSGPTAVLQSGHRARRGGARRRIGGADDPCTDGRPPEHGMGRDPRRDVSTTRRPTTRPAES